MGKMQCLNYSPHCTVRNACLRIAAKKNFASGRPAAATNLRTYYSRTSSRVAILTKLISPSRI